MNSQTKKLAAISLAASLSIGVGVGYVMARPSRNFVKAKRAAHSAMFRNDQAGLRTALSNFARLESNSQVRPYALYYESWTQWSLAGSFMAAGDVQPARAALEQSVKFAKAAVAERPNDADFQAMLANALISLAVTDDKQFPALIGQVVAARRKALALDAANPRVLLMDATMIFNSPPQAGGDQEKGVARWRESIAAFEHAHPDPLSPDWGRAEAYGWLAGRYLAMNPPRYAEACEASQNALRLEPDFWYVKTQVVAEIEKKSPGGCRSRL